MSAVAEEQWVYLAESQEPSFDYGDPVFKIASTGVHLTIIVEGAFSTYANAEAALDKRIARLAGVEILDQFVSQGSDSSVRNVLWRESAAREVRHGDQTCWQEITRTRVDAHTS